MSDAEPRVIGGVTVWLVAMAPATNPARASLLVLLRRGLWGKAVARVAGWLGARAASRWLARHGIECGCTRREATLDTWGQTLIRYLRAALRRAPRR